MSTFTNHFFHYYTGRSFHCHVLTVFILLALLNVTSAALQLGRSDANATDPPPVQDFDWGTIVPSNQLNWQECYTGFQCTRFNVPLDYSDYSGEKAVIALIRLPSKLAPSDANYRGPILFNPGGPGGSGVDFMLGLGSAFQSVIGDEFDFVGFDPRGVGHTTPHLDIFSSTPESIVIQTQASNSMNTSSESLGKLSGLAQIVSNLSVSRAKLYMEHVSTPEVAMDMMNIVKAYGMDKLQYWGFSYGTVIGATFAAMFPGNVVRIILDGVVDSEDYYATFEGDDLVDADHALSWFYEDCVNAGPELCSIYEPTVSQIRDRVNGFSERLKTQPVAFVNETDGSQGLVGYDIVKGLLFQMVYNPHTIGKPFADAFAALEAGIPEPIWTLSIDALAQSLIRDTCSPNNTVTDFGVLSLIAISCGDGTPIHDTYDELTSYFSTLAGKSSFADVWTSRIACSAWKIQAKQRFQGNFVANTSFPILLIGNTADPVTPLRNAHKMASGFSGAVVLQQNSPGHSSIAGLSICTSSAVRDYFRNGTLPTPGTICAAESSPFTDTSGIMRAREIGGWSPEFVDAIQEIRNRAFQYMRRRL